MGCMDLNSFVDFPDQFFGEPVEAESVSLQGFHEILELVHSIMEMFQDGIPDFMSLGSVYHALIQKHSMC